MYLISRKRQTVGVLTNSDIPITFCISLHVRAFIVRLLAMSPLAHGYFYLLESRASGYVKPKLHLYSGRPR
jgi:hypothetical protein